MVQKLLYATVAILLLVVSTSQAQVVKFPEADTRFSEGTDASVTVSVVNFQTTDFTVQVRALTRDEYLELPAETREACGSLENADFAQASDFEFSAQNLTINRDGDFDVPIRLVDDDTQEGQQVIVFFIDVFENSQGVSVGRDCTTGTIALDDSDAVSLNTTVVELLTVNEGIGVLNIAVSLVGVSELETELLVFNAEGAERGIDFTVSNTFVLQPFQTEILIPVQIMDDSVAEDTETIGLNIQIDGTAQTERVATITIIDNDVVTIGFANDSQTVEEGERLLLCIDVFEPENAQLLRDTLYMIRSMPSSTADGHFQPVNREFFLEPKGCFTVRTFENTLQDGPRSFTLTFTNLIPTPLTRINPDTLTITIMDDDFPPNVPEITEIFTEDGKTLEIKWQVNITELRPVDSLTVTITVVDEKATEKPEDDSDENEATPEAAAEAQEQTEFTVDLPGDAISYTFEEFLSNKSYSVNVCATNVVGETCSGPTGFRTETVTAGAIVTGSTPPPQSPTVIIIIVVIVVFVLLFCLLCFLILCVCCLREHDAKNYYPQKTEEKYREQYDEYRGQSDEDSENSEIV